MLQDLQYETDAPPLNGHVRVKRGTCLEQMGRFAREPLRKCVYVWRKP